MFTKLDTQIEAVLARPPWPAWIINSFYFLSVEPNEHIIQIVLI